MKINIKTSLSPPWHSNAHKPPSPYNTSLIGQKLDIKIKDKKYTHNLSLSPLSFPPHAQKNKKHYKNYYITHFTEKQKVKNVYKCLHNTFLLHNTTKRLKTTT